MLFIDLMNMKKKFGFIPWTLDRNNIFRCLKNFASFAFILNQMICLVQKIFLNIVYNLDETDLINLI